MAILVIQLARFGDIFQTWPTLKALRRTYPKADLHLLVRERFVEATEGLQDLGVRIHTLPTASILGPILTGSEDVVRNEAAAINELENFLNPLRQVSFSSIINLSFSPLSSYLTDELTTPDSKVCGYTRFSDGYLNIPDDSSAYFYAQVGIDKSNRYHLCDVFAAVAGVDLDENDFSHPSKTAAKTGSIVVHLGASQAEKIYPPELWSEVLAGLVGQIHQKIILVGSREEKALADAIESKVNSTQLTNAVGETRISDLCRLVSEADLLIGADSAPVQIASLTGTPVLNLSCDAVNFWETGPRVNGSRILHAQEMHQIHPSRVCCETFSLIKGEKPQSPFIQRTQDRFESHPEQPSFLWNLIQALYTATDYPALPEGASALAFQRLFDLSELALQQLDQWQRKGPTSATTAILQSVDEMLVQLPKMDSHIAPILGWFQTQRLRLGPATPEQTLKSTRELFEQLRWISAVYQGPTSAERLIQRAKELVALCVPQLRECDLAPVQDAFQELMSLAQAISTKENTTKVAEKSWASVLNSLQNALERRDFVEAADILEFDWFELLQWTSGELSCESGTASPNRSTPHA